MKRTLNELAHRCLIALTNLGFLTAAATLQGAAITWGPATNIAGDSDVLNAGTPVYAYTWSGITSTVNGVSFTGSGRTNSWNNVLAPAFTNYGPAYFTSKSTPFSALSTAYSNILIGAYYVVRLPAPVTLENLTIGRNYSLQVWVNDPRGPENARSETITSAGGNTNTLKFSINSTNSNPGGPGQYTIGTFKADATNQTFTLNGGTGGVAQLNALQLRDVTPNLVFNGTFDTNIAGWSTSTASWSFPGDSSGGPGGCLGLFPILPLGANTSQAFNGLVPGSNYLCSWSGSDAGIYTPVAVYVDSAVMRYYSGADGSWQYFGFVFTAQSMIGSHDISFSIPSVPGFYPYLVDNVSIRSIPEPPRPTIEMFSTQNWIALLVSGPTGQSVVVEASTNLVSWQPFATNAMPFFYEGIPKNPISTFFRASKPL